MRKSIVLAMCMGIALTGGVEAKDPPPFKDFKAKRVKPPKPGTRKRITIQIEPTQETPRAATPSTAGAAPKTKREARYGWFWDGVSPSLSQSTGPGRLEDALSVIAQSPSGVAVPRLQTLQDVAKTRGIDILKATVGTDVSPALALAVIWTESAGKADARSSAGAEGLMQLMPATAERFGVSNRLEPAQNITGGVKYLDWLMKEFGGDPLMVLAAYNAGEGAVRKHKGVPPFTETRDYVPKVLATFKLARGLCRTPPELITDGCVFAALN